MWVYAGIGLALRSILEMGYICGGTFGLRIILLNRYFFLPNCF